MQNDNLKYKNNRNKFFLNFDISFLFLHFDFWI